ncbi:MAG: hypothetical protein U9N59_10565 [Campylobacterota bacterium]|nr:hypothetical protein [Campylobacterota bacterium]
MKLNINFDLLDSAISKMGAKKIIFEPKATTPEPPNIGDTAGVEININDIEINLDGGGLFEYDGRQVLLFIPNHNPRYKSIEEVLHDPMRGNRFHVSDCSTLQQMKERNNYNKYHVTQNLSGKFKIYNEGKEKDGQNAKLHVCKNCLEKLNYKNYKNEIYNKKQEIFENFDIGEFFERYSTLFEYLPNIESDRQKEATTYTDNWEAVSKDYRASKNYVCETCDTSFIKDKHLLHTHHMNGKKDDNTQSNLKAVCIDCHRKEPKHRHVYMDYEQLQKINITRREQNKVNIQGWDDVFKFTDLSIHGYLKLIENQYSIPDVATILEYQGKKVALDISWTRNNKKSAVVTEYAYDLLNFDDWNILTIGDAIIEYHKRATNDIQNQAQSALELEAMMNYTTQIETILESMGAKARGLHGKVTKVQKKLSKDVVFRLRRIATIRNKKMHQAGFENYIFKDFEDDCRIVLDYLNKIIKF